MKGTPWVVAFCLFVAASLPLTNCGGSSNPPTPVPSPVVVASPSPSPLPSPSAAPSPSPQPSATPDPTPTPTPHPTSTPPPPDLIITILGDNGGMSYSPASANASVGQTVIWRNSDSTLHTATANGGAFDTNLIAPGAEVSILMQSSGNFNYHCNVHPGMTGSLSVSP